jgi:hypothetical protein
MRYMLLAQILLLTSFAFANDQLVSCVISKSSILSMSSAGIAQVSNLGLIEVICSVSARPFPSKPGESRKGLRAATTAYQISGHGIRKEVASKANESGGGENQEREYVNFYLYLPLEPAERDIEANRYLDRLQKSAPALIADSRRKQMLETVSELIPQHRVGNFQIDCRVLDGTRVIGVGVVELQVLFKGRFSDSDRLPGYWEAQPSKTEP